MLKQDIRRLIIYPLFNTLIFAQLSQRLCGYLHGPIHNNGAEHSFGKIVIDLREDFELKKIYQENFLNEVTMYFYEIPLDGIRILTAAVVYYVVGMIWYAPFLFGQEWKGHDHMLKKEGEPADKLSPPFFYRSLSYVGEFIISFIIAYMLAVFMAIAGAETIHEGMLVAFWIWAGFIATTHFSAVLWGRKTVKHFFIHAGFMLIGLLAMSAIYMAF